MKLLRSWVVLGLTGVVVASACGGNTGNSQAESNTNWMRSCTSDADCGSLSCECSVCTLPCDSATQCSSLGLMAACTDAESFPECGSKDRRVCAPRCEIDEDCSAFASTCENETCGFRISETDGGSGGARASGGASSTGGASSNGGRGTATDAGSPLCPLTSSTCPEGCRSFGARHYDDNEQCLEAARPFGCWPEDGTVTDDTGCLKVTDTTEGPTSGRVDYYTLSSGSFVDALVAGTPGSFERCSEADMERVPGAEDCSSRGDGGVVALKPIEACPGGLTAPAPASDPFDLNGFTIDGDTLTIEVSGGCETEEFSLCYGELLGMSDPPSASVHAVYDAAALCDPPQDLMLRFDLAPLADFVSPAGGLLNVSVWNRDEEGKAVSYGSTLYHWGALSCMDRQFLAAAEAVDAAQSADRTCSTSDDCQWVRATTECSTHCGTAVSSSGASDLADALENISAAACIDFEADGCDPPAPTPCPQPPAIVCVDGACATPAP